GRGRGGIEVESVVRVDSEAKPEVESDGDFDISVAFQSKSRNANIKMDRIAGCIYERDFLLQAQMDGQTVVAVQCDIQLAGALGWIKRVAGSRVHQQIQSSGADGIPEGLFDCILQRGQPVAAGCGDVVPELLEQSFAEVLDEIGGAGQAIADQGQFDVE